MDNNIVPKYHHTAIRARLGNTVTPIISRLLLLKPITYILMAPKFRDDTSLFNWLHQKHIHREVVTITAQVVATAKTSEWIAFKTA